MTGEHTKMRANHLDHPLMVGYSREHQPILPHEFRQDLSESKKLKKEKRNRSVRIILANSSGNLFKICYLML